LKLFPYNTCMCVYIYTYTLILLHKVTLFRSDAPIFLLPIFQRPSSGSLQRSFGSGARTWHLGAVASWIQGEEYRKIGVLWDSTTTNDDWSSTNLRLQ
jgi:hypothetical protein